MVVSGGADLALKLEEQGYAWLEDGGIENLDIKTWYTVKVDLDIANGLYYVTLPGVHEEPVKVKAFKSKKKPVPTKITHISFASWNDGPGTVYIDNVR